MRFPLGVAALAATALLTASVPAQQLRTFGGTDPERKASTVFLAIVKGEESFDMKGGAAINYSPPTWQDSYDAQLDSGKFNNTNQRLGKNWWTSFDTYSPLEFGGTKIPAGAYYLGIHVDQGGKFQLLFLDPKTVLTSGWVPFMATPWKTELKAPLTFAKNSLPEAVEKMEIAITADQKNPTNGKFSIKWGKHELSAEVKFMVEGAKDAAAPKK